MSDRESVRFRKQDLLARQLVVSARWSVAYKLIPRFEIASFKFICYFNSSSITLYEGV